MSQKKLLIILSVILLGLTISSTVKAEEKTRKYGLEVSVAVPQGAGIAIIYRPGPYWLDIGAGPTYNGIALGFFGMVEADPLQRLPVRLSLAVEAGHSFDGDLSHFDKDLPSSVSYSYFSLLPTFRLGGSSCSFFLRAGPSWLDINSSSPHFNSGSNITVSRIHASAVIFPAAKLGVSLHF